MTTSGDPRLPSYEPSRNPMPWPSRPASRGPNFPTLATDPLRPRYTEKLATSPHFPTLAEAAQRRRDFWSKAFARGSIGLMVGAVVGAFWFGTGVFPAGAFVVGLILFGATCFVSGCRNRSRLP